MKRTLLFSALTAVTLAACGGPGPQPLKSVISQALTRAEEQYLLMAEKYADREELLPKSYAHGKDLASDSRWWCSGFFPGALWYLYENSGDTTLLHYARQYTARVEREKFTTNNHDVGFILGCSFGNGLRLTGDESYKEVLLTGARSLATRFDPAVGLIRSWDAWDEKSARLAYPVIIDNMMNLELLLRAADYSGDESLRAIAVSHADSTMKNHFRPDGSSSHNVCYDEASGRPLWKQTWQGYADDSAWSRGQAWGLYGYTYMYRLTGRESYLEQARKIARFLLDHERMPADGIPYWDFDAPDIPDSPRDASAAAIMASALIELSDYAEEAEAIRYLAFAEKQIRTLASPEYTASAGENGNFILMHSTGNYPGNSEIDVPLTYADYYYVEALTRMKHKLQDGAAISD